MSRLRSALFAAAVAGYLAPLDGYGRPSVGRKRRHAKPEKKAKRKAQKRARQVNRG